MRKLLALMLHGLQADKEPLLLDHVPVVPLPIPGAKTLSEKLMDARQRYGRAFKCAAPDQDREVYVSPDQVRIVKAGRAPTQAMATPKRESRVEPLRAAGGRS